MVIRVEHVVLAVAVPSQRDETACFHLGVEVALFCLLVVHLGVAQHRHILILLDRIVALLPAIRQIHLVQPTRQVRLERDVLVQNGPLRRARLLH